MNKSELVLFGDSVTALGIVMLSAPLLMYMNLFAGSPIGLPYSLILLSMQVGAVGGIFAAVGSVPHLTMKVHEFVNYFWLAIGSASCAYLSWRLHGVGELFGVAMVFVVASALASMFFAVRRQMHTA